MQSRNSKGRWKKSRKWIWFIFSLALLSAVIADKYYLTEERLQGMSYENVTPIKQALAQAEGKNYEEKIYNVKSKILDDLSVGCETLNVEDPDGAIIFDSNKKPSIGRFMFQRDTVKHYVKKYEGRDIQNAEAVAIAIDPVKSKSLAEKIIFTETYGASRDWVTCDKKKSITMRADFIKEIESI